MRESILAILRNLSHLDRLKRLFWQELNYDRVNQTLPMWDVPAEDEAVRTPIIVCSEVLV